LLGGNLDEVRIRLPDRVEAGLDAAHVVHVLDRPLLARRNDQPPLVVGLRHLRDKLQRRSARGLVAGGWRLVTGRWRPLTGVRRLATDRRVRHLDVDERAQAVVLAEVAARRLVARRAIGDAPYRVEPDEARAVAVRVQPARFDGRADRARLAAVLVHDDLRL